MTTTVTGKRNSTWLTGTFQSFSPHTISVGVVTAATSLNGEIACATKAAAC